MSLNDPRILIKKLEELSSQFYDWLYISKDTRDEAQYKQRLCTTRIDNASHAVAVKADELEYSREDLHCIWQLIERYRDEYFYANGLAAETFQLAQKALNDARKTQYHCQGQLQAAMQWLERALQRLEQAKTALCHARSELSAARVALASAEAALQAAQREANHNPQRSYWREETAVNNAELRVSKGQQAVNAVESEVQLARGEVEKAQMRVNQCEHAVQLADQAVALSNLTYKNATSCYGSAQRGLEHVEAASKALANAQSSFEEVEDAVERMQAKIREVQVHIETDASRSLHSAENYEDLVQHHTFEALNILQYYIEILKKINQDGP